MDSSAINWQAVIACVIVSMISGSLWYNPKTFFPAWWKVVGNGRTPGMQNMGMIWAIETGNHLVNFLLFGAILGAWR